MHERSILSPYSLDLLEMLPGYSSMNSGFVIFILYGCVTILESESVMFLHRHNYRTYRRQNVCRILPKLHVEKSLFICIPPSSCASQPQCKRSPGIPPPKRYGSPGVVCSLLCKANIVWKVCIRPLNRVSCDGFGRLHISARK